MEKQTPQEEGLVTEPVEAKRQIKTSKMKSQLSKPKSRRSILTERVGIGAERKRETIKIKISNKRTRALYGC